MGRRISGRRMVLITVHFPKPVLDRMDRLVRDLHVFPNRSELIRAAVLRLLESYERPRGGLVAGL